MLMMMLLVYIVVHFHKILCGFQEALGQTRSHFLHFSSLTFSGLQTLLHLSLGPPDNFEILDLFLCVMNILKVNSSVPELSISV